MALQHICHSQSTELTETEHQRYFDLYSYEFSALCNGEVPHVTTGYNGLHLRGVKYCVHVAIRGAQATCLKQT